MHDRLNKLIADAIRSHAAPLPDYARPDDDGDRFVGGPAFVGDRPCHVNDLSRVGSYSTYAYRTTLVPLDGRLRSITYWKPGVFFLPDETGLRPELAYDGDPLRRRAPVVPVASKGSKKAIQKRVFAHLMEPLERLAAFYGRTGQRWEVVVERERRRCAEFGEPFAMPELPLDPRALS